MLPVADLPCHGGAVRRRRTGGISGRTDDYGENMLYASRGMQTEMMISGRLLPVVCGLQWCDAKRYFPGQSFITLHSRYVACSHHRNRLPHPYLSVTIRKKRGGSLQCVLCIDCAFLACYAAHRGENLHVFSPDPSFRALPVPLQGHWVYPVKLSRLRSRGDCLWQSFRSLAAYCSPSAHPRTRSAGCGVSRRFRCCGLIDDIARLVSPALRARRQPPRTRGV